MREIKFRAWDKVNKFWGDPDNLAITLTGKLCAEDAFDGQITEFTDSPFEIMQFTRLPDKNGKEIYEGDIVRYNFKTVKDYIDLKVVFYVGAFLQQPIGEETNPDLYYDWNEVEIIGNIYENPELIKDALCQN